MMTSYVVTCPQRECRWRGSLLPREGFNAWDGGKPNRRLVAFQCPECGSEWQARVVGDDVVPLRADEAVPGMK